MTSRILCIALAVGALAACADNDETVVPPGAGGAGGGGGGSGGEGCPAGSHDDGSGACVTTLGGWTAAPSIANRRDHHVTFAVEVPSGTFIYVAGGAVDMMTAVSEIERAPVLAEGGLGSWETLATTLTAVGPCVAQAGRKVVVAGGIRAPGGVQPGVSLGDVADDGSITFTDAGAMLHERFHGTMVTHGGWVYALGGIQADGRSQATVERAPFDEAGLGAFQAEADLPGPRSHHAAVVHDGAIYLVAGLDRYDGEPFPYSDTDFADVIRSTIAEDGSLGAWETVGQLPAALAVHAAFVHLDQLYVVSGLEGETFIGRVQRATFAENGTLGAFENLPAELPIVRGHCHQIPVVDDLIFSVAGAALEGVMMKSQAEAFWARLE
jgi:hypothetical protein